LNTAILVIYLFLFAVTAVVMLISYRRIREGSREYATAKTSLEDIVLSFDRDLNAQKTRIQDVVERSENAWLENKRKMEKMISEAVDIKNDIEDLAKADQRLLMKHEALEKRIDQLFSRQMETPKEEGAVKSSGREVEMSPVAVQPAMVIGRERALAPLTDTELKILKVLGSEGEQTASQIRRVIALTREHTARLMKKLYVRGYVERNTTMMPYVYRLKKEMKHLLRPQGEQT
jgi:hypothetical protein